MTFRPKSDRVPGLPFRYLTLMTVVLFLMITFSGLSQRYFTKTYSVVDGLLSSTIFDIVQDSQGMIWCASAKGISRYDGFNWLSHNSISGKTGYGYHFIRCDEKGILWTLSNYNQFQISVYKGKKWEVFPVNVKKTLNGDIIAFDVIYKSDEPVFIIATSQNGMYVGEKNIWRNIGLPRTFSGAKIKGMSRSGSTFYVATDHGIFRFEDGITDPLIKLNRQLPGKKINAVKSGFVCSSGKPGRKLWLLGSDWLGYFLDDKFYPVVKRFSLTPDNSYPTGVICASEHGSIFFGNRLNLFHCTEQDPTPVPVGRKQGLAGEGALTIMVDREKNTWIGGLRGLTAIPYSKFTNYTNSDGMLDNEVSSALETSPGNYVFGHDGSISFYDGTRFEEIKFNRIPEGEFKETRVQDICLDSEKNLWLACANLRLAKVSPSRQITWYSHLFPENERIVSVIQMHDGKMLIGGPEHLYIFGNGQFSHANTGKFTLLGTRKLFNGRDNRIYLGTYSQGLLEWVPGNIIQYHIPGNRLANNVFAFCEDSEGNRWVGNSDGLYILEDKMYKKADFVGLPVNRSVYLILEEKPGILWIGTDDGVYRWNGKNLMHFTVRDGLSGPDINRDAGFIDSKGYIWFGTNMGATRIHPDFEKTLNQIPPPRIILDSLVTPDGSHLFNQDHYLPYKENNLEFFFTSVSFLDEKRLKISWKLENFDRQWSDEMSGSTRSLRYLNLPPGDYRFHIRAKNALGVWSESIVSPIIHIRYPVYMQWWFILCCLAALGAIGYFIFRYTINKRYNILLAETVSTRTRELQESERQLKKSNQSKDRFFSIIAHDLRSPFNVILGYLDLLTDKSFDFSEPEKEDILDKVKKSAHSTLGLLDNLLAWARTQKGDLKVNRTTFNISELIEENILQAESVATAKKITITSKNNAPVKVYADRDMIHTVIRNLISNAIKFTFPGGVIKLDVQVMPDLFALISVRDTGCGIPPENLPKLFSIDERLATKGTQKESGTGLGLILCMEFITLNDGKIWAESEVGKGSTFYFNLKMG